MVRATAEPVKPDTGSVRYLGIVTAVGLVAEGRRRTQFQTVVSLAVAVAITLFLSSRTDEVPLATLWTLFLGRRRSQQQNVTPEMVAEINSLQNLTSKLATIDRQAAEIHSFTSRLDAAYKELESTNARLKEIAFKDDVTGLYRRRFLSLRLEEEVSRYRRLSHPVSLVLLDLDGFNAAKDKYGRGVGEDILRDCAQILMKHTPGIHVVSRFDADLFAILLVETSNGDARLYANRIGEAVAVYPFSHGKVMKASFGIASLPDSEEATAEAVFQAADEALFAAKRSKEPRA